MMIAKVNNMKSFICFSILALLIFIVSCGGTILEELPVIAENVRAIEITDLSVSTTTNSATIT
jgi:hypothetical protein